jgi:Protein of unknown function (DUF3016)
MRCMMRLLISGLAIALSAPAEAAVSVTFVEPDRYSDVGLYRNGNSAGRERVFREISQQFERLGERYLKPNQTLKIEVLDIDLAGRFEPWRPFAYDVRFMRTITWPRITIRYTLEEDGRVTASAKESISDLDYLAHADLRTSYDPLRYEKAMLGDWFRARFRRD